MRKVQGCFNLNDVSVEKWEPHVLTLWTINSGRESRGKRIFVILRNINNIRLEMPYKREVCLQKCHHILSHM